ncbi:hypothetical protein H0H87_002955, partial [Tephrocybe sp. NHM501043]
RGIHDIDRPFSFANKPEYIFHDSPGFETGDEDQLKKVQEFIQKRAKATNVDDQLHAIWCLSLVLPCMWHLLAVQVLLCS